MRSHNTVEYAAKRLSTDVAKLVTETFQLEPRLEDTMLEAKVFPSSKVDGISNGLCNAHLMYL